MLKSLVFVALFGLCMCVFIAASAFDGSVGFKAGSVKAGLDKAGSVKTLRFPRQMRKFVDSYIKDNDMELAEIRDRSARPFTIIDSVMEHYDLPVELRYLAVIESELRATAVSRVGAKGPWQLMAATARDLGLTVSHRSDERTNYYKSTHAAALYLRDLHGEFKDWLLVLAAYNAGPGPVYRAIRLSGSRNFWVLESYLPAETRQHVRRFLATAYYFKVSGPVVDPVNLAPDGAAPGGVAPGAVAQDAVASAGGQSVLAGDYAGLGGVGYGAVLRGVIDGAGVEQGVGDGAGVGGGLLGGGVAFEDGNGRAVFAGVTGAGVLRKEICSAFGRRSEAVL